MRKNRQRTTRLIIALSLAFLLAAGAGLYSGSRYISNKLMDSGKAMATDIALLVKNNFQMTDGEVAYMKSLTFNEMEVDPINQRLMDVGNGVVLNAAVTNVYIIAPLSREEYRLCDSEEAAAFLGFELGQPLDGVWLLNGKINDEGVFEVAQRDDIYRYTVLTQGQRLGMERREAFGEFSSDAWGSFITGYAPIYTDEGSFVGLLGIDMDPDPYQSSAQHMVFLIIILFAFTVLMTSALFIIFYLKYTKAREGQRQFEFYSKMSHEMRNPMNGILGAAALAKTESDPSALHQNIEQIESSGKYLMELINKTLDYQNRGAPQAPTEEKTPQPSAGRAPSPGLSFPELPGKRILLCEDHPLNAQITRKMLERAGCSTETAANGQIGLELFSGSEPGFFDAILMDIRMPVMDGLEASERIRALAREDAKTIPIIALTANSYDEDQKAAREAGMDAHLTKPVELKALYQTLSDMISARVKPDGGRRRQK